ncbi:hypothetical protein ACFE04_024979 [Oxalis oulophora]
MIQNRNVSSRRSLTYPAVYSTEHLSPSTVIHSLLDLSHEIQSLKTSLPSINRRYESETFRLIENVSIFLQEIRNGSSGSGLLSLTDLRSTLQKALYLLEDCTRGSTRLWMIMNSGRVVEQFQELTHAIGSGLEVFPLGSGQLPGEVEELVEFIINQALKARFEIDPDDKRVMDTVNLVLDQFMNGSDPDMTQIKSVMDHMRIYTWCECNEEIKFLKREIEFEILNNEENSKKISFLSSLVGFMIYCRCVMFDFDFESQQKVKVKVNEVEVEVINGLDLDDFRCPISYEIMKDPVALCTGHTYDRSSILKWFRSGNYTCPITGEKLASTELVPNLTLQHIIQQCCPNVFKSKSKSEKEAFPWSSAAKQAVKMASLFLVSKLDFGTRREKNNAVYETRILTKASCFSRSCLVKSGVIPHLVDLLMSSDTWAQENAAAALLNLSKDSRNRGLIVEHGGLNVIVYVLKKGIKIEARQHAAATIFYMASVEEYRRQIGENPNSVQSLVNLVREGNPRGKKNALAAILGLLMHPENFSRVLDSGIVQLLVDLLKSSDIEEIITDSLAVLATLSENPDGAITILHHDALNIILKLLDSSSSAGKEYCVSLLSSLCINGGAQVFAILGKNPSLMGSLYSLISEGSSRASKKASALIGILHEFYERKILWLD